MITDVLQRQQEWQYCDNGCVTASARVTIVITDVLQRQQEWQYCDNGCVTASARVTIL